MPNYESSQSQDSIFEHWSSDSEAVFKSHATRVADGKNNSQYN